MSRTVTEMTPMTDTRQEDGSREWSVRNEDFALEFVGVRLGHSSSQTPGSQRWAEISIYRTAAGKYVVAGVGRTVLPGELDRAWAHVCPTPDCVIRHLVKSGRRGGGRYIPHVSRVALQQARAVDGGMRDATLVEVVD